MGVGDFQANQLLSYFILSPYTLLSISKILVSRKAPPRSIILTLQKPTFASSPSPTNHICISCPPADYLAPLQNWETAEARFALCVVQQTDSRNMRLLQFVRLYRRQDSLRTWATRNYLCTGNLEIKKCPTTFGDGVAKDPYGGSADKFCHRLILPTTKTRRRKKNFGNSQPNEIKSTGLRCPRSTR